MSNLLDNAFKYVVTRASAQGAGTAGPSSGFHVTLRVYSLDAGQLGGAAAGAEETLGAVLVEVQDDGPGVTEEELRRLGERGCVEAQMILALDACGWWSDMENACLLCLCSFRGAWAAAAAVPGTGEGLFVARRSD